MNLLKLRNGQLKKLRKEMRKLEKLDKIRLRRVEEGQKRETLTEIELLKQIMVLRNPYRWLRNSAMYNITFPAYRVFADMKIKAFCTVVHQCLKCCVWVTHSI